MLADFGSAHGLVWTALSYFNAAGADTDCEIGEEHPETHLMPLARDAAFVRRPHVTIFGTDYDTPDGTCIRVTSTLRTSRRRTYSPCKQARAGRLLRTTLAMDAAFRFEKS